MKPRVTGNLPTASDDIRSVEGALIVADLLFGADGVLTGIRFNHDYVASRRLRDGRVTLICPNNRSERVT